VLLPLTLLHTPLHNKVILDVLVKPEQPVVSYLTALTGLTREAVQARGVPLQEAVAQLRACLPASAILVGQNILQVRAHQWVGVGPWGWGWGGVGAGGPPPPPPPPHTHKHTCWSSAAHAR
jgi:hypothetical protein